MEYRRFNNKFNFAIIERSQVSERGFPLSTEPQIGGFFVIASVDFLDFFHDFVQPSE